MHANATVGLIEKGRTSFDHGSVHVHVHGHDRGSDHANVYATVDGRWEIAASRALMVV